MENNCPCKKKCAECERNKSADKKTTIALMFIISLLATIGCSVGMGCLATYNYLAPMDHYEAIICSLIAGMMAGLFLLVYVVSESERMSFEKEYRR